MLIEQPARWLRIFYPHALWRMDKNDHSVYLTFDDGPIPEATLYPRHIGPVWSKGYVLYGG